MEDILYGFFSLSFCVCILQHVFHFCGIMLMLPGENSNEHVDIFNSSRAQPACEPNFEFLPTWRIAHKCVTNHKTAKSCCGRQKIKKTARRIGWIVRSFYMTNVSHIACITLSLEHKLFKLPGVYPDSCLLALRHNIRSTVYLKD